MFVFSSNEASVFLKWHIKSCIKP